MLLKQLAAITGDPDGLDLFGSRDLGNSLILLERSSAIIARTIQVNLA